MRAGNLHLAWTHALNEQKVQKAATAYPYGPYTKASTLLRSMYTVLPSEPASIDSLSFSDVLY